LLGLCLLGLFAYLLRDRVLAGQNDFVQLYTSARLVGTPGLYDPEANKVVHREVLGGVFLESVYCSRPPFYGFLLKPLARLPYLTAYWIFQAISFASLVGFLYMFRPGGGEFFLFASLSLPLLSALATGQDVTIAVLLAAVSLRLSEKGKDFASGLVLSLCAIKFHLFVLVPVVVLIHKRWRLLAGGVAGGAVLMTLSFIAQGPGWPLEYLPMLSNPELHPGPEHMPNLRGTWFALTGGESKPALAAMGAMVTLGIAWLARGIRSYPVMFALALVGGILVSYHNYLQDCLVLLLAFGIVLHQAEGARLRGILGIANTPPPFLGLLVGVPYNVMAPLLLLGVVGMALAGRLNLLPRKPVEVLTPLSHQ